MHLTLLVESNEQLRNIYNLNLKTWVGSDSVGVKYGSQFNAILQMQDKVDLIIVRAKSENEETAKVVLDTIKDSGLDIPVIITGSANIELSEKVVQLNTGLELPPLIKQSASFLGVTAKDMAALHVGSHFEVSIDFFKDIKRSVVDVYTKTENSQFQPLFTAEEDFTSKQITDLITTGVSKLYVKSADRLRFVSNVTAELVAKIPAQEMSNDDVVKVQEITIGLLQEKLGRMGINEETISLSKKSMKQMVTSARKNPKLGSLVGNLLKNKTSYRFKHTQVLTHVCLHIMEHIDWGNDEQKNKIAFVAFFHDIVLENDLQAMVHSEEDFKKSDLSASEKDLVKKHAQIAAELVIKYPSAPMGADIIVRQHHGVNHGIGFSEVYSGNMSPMTIVFILAEHFTDALLRSGDSNMDTVGTIAQMRKRFPTQRFQKIIDLIDKITV